MQQFDNMIKSVQKIISLKKHGKEIEFCYTASGLRSDASITECQKELQKLLTEKTEMQEKYKRKIQKVRNFPTVMGYKEYKKGIEKERKIDTDRIYAHGTNLYTILNKRQATSI